MIIRRTLPSLLLGLTLFVVPAVSRPQSATRTEILAEEQAVKATELHPYEPTRAEHIFRIIKKEFLDDPSGFYPASGSVYRGTGFALGGGYRFYVRDRTYLDAKALISVHRSSLAEMSAHSLGHLRRKLDFDLRLGSRHVNEVAFYGLGPDSSDHPSDFAFNEGFGGLGVNLRPVYPVVVASRTDYEQYDLKSNGNALAPGVGRRPIYLHYTESAGIDWRPAAGYARRGGLYEMRYHRYDGHSTPSFDRVEAEVIQHIPLLRENWVISTHGYVDSLVNNASNVPYLLIPSLGGATTLRGYQSWRFRDNNSLLLQGEFRWIPNRYGVDMAIFYDAGKVTRTRSELSLRGLRKDFGSEIRFHGPAQTPIRFGIARGNEGWHLLVSGTAAF